MVRFEKLLWEQAANVKILGRERVIPGPSKWFNENRSDWYKATQHTVFNSGISGAFFRAFEPLFQRFIYRWRLDIAHQRGLTLEDTMLFTDRELRRCYFFETLTRQNLHPYTVLFMKKRRARYYKVERALRGFYVPEWVRKEAEERQLSETIDNIFTWEKFVYQEYMSDMTPSARWSALPKLNPLELFTYYGLFDVDSWDRYFYNEAFYDKTDKKVLNEAKNPFNRFNLGSAEGRAQFEKEVNTFLTNTPFALTKPGQKFDFNRFYALEALANKRDTSKYDNALLESVKSELAAFNEVPKDNGTNKTRKLKAVLPSWALPAADKTIQA